MSIESLPSFTGTYFKNSLQQPLTIDSCNRINLVFQFERILKARHQVSSIEGIVVYYRPVTSAESIDKNPYLELCDSYTLRMIPSLPFQDYYSRILGEEDRGRVVIDSTHLTSLGMQNGDKVVMIGDGDWIRIYERSQYELKFNNDSQEI